MMSGNRLCRRKGEQGAGHQIFPEVAKIPALRVKQSDTMRDMLNVFPDHGDHLRALARADEHVADVMRDIGYDGPVELFTMYCCMFAAKEVSAILRDRPEAWLREHRAALRRLRSQYAAKHGQQPNVAVLLSIYVGKMQL